MRFLGQTLLAGVFVLGACAGGDKAANSDTATAAPASDTLALYGKGKVTLTKGRHGRYQRHARRCGARCFRRHCRSAHHGHDSRSQDDR